MKKERSLLGNLLKKTILWTTAAVGSAAIGQQLLLYLAQKKRDMTPHETFHGKYGETAYTKIGHGKVLVLLHSTLVGSGRMEWEQTAKLLAEHYCVYCVDMPGFGQSQKPRTPWTVYDYALWLREFLAEGIGRKVCVVGVGNSADFALMAKKLGCSQIRRLVLVRPEGLAKGFATGQDTQDLKLLELPLIGTQKFLMGTTSAAVREVWEKAVFAPEKLDQALWKKAAVSARIGKGAQMVYAAGCCRFWSVDSRDAFVKADCPVAVVWGEADRDISADVLREAEKLRPDGVYYLFEQTAMLPHVENSKAFAARVTAFLEGEET